MTFEREPITERDVVEFDARVALLDAVDQFVASRGGPVDVFVPESVREYAERTLQQVAAGLTARSVVAELRARHDLPPCWMLDVGALLRSVRLRGVAGL